MSDYDTASFAELGLSSALCNALSQQGIDSPFPIQTLTIPDALSGRDICGKAKTGSGKTLAFGLPVLQTASSSRSRRPRSLILVPTRELARQVTDVLEPLGDALECRVGCVYGGAPMRKHIKMLSRGVDVLVATPGRLIGLCEDGYCSLAAVERVVIDEADRMADMGFMPQIQVILRDIENSFQTLLFSATLDGSVNRLVRRYMSDPVTKEVWAADKSVTNMKHRFFYVHQMDKVRVVAGISEGVDRTLVFSQTKRGCARLARQLRQEGVKADPIHGDLTQKAREQALQRFTEGSTRVLVATDVAARGIHVDDVDVVVHFDPPDDCKAYLHRSGRTARAGHEGMVVTLVEWDQVLDVRRLQHYLKLEEPIVEVFSPDKRLRDLTSWEPTEAENVA